MTSLSQNLCRCLYILALSGSKIDDDPPNDQDDLQDYAEYETGTRSYQTESDLWRTIKKERYVGIHGEIQHPMAEDQEPNDAADAQVPEEWEGDHRSHQRPHDAHEKPMRPMHYRGTQIAQSLDEVHLGDGLVFHAGRFECEEQYVGYLGGRH